MNLIDELFKLRIICSDSLFVRYRKHPCQLRLVAKARHISLINRGEVSNLAEDTYARLVCRYYID